jgi:hypothetical protein
MPRVGDRPAVPPGVELVGGDPHAPTDPVLATADAGAAALAEG